MNPLTCGRLLPMLVTLAVLVPSSLYAAKPPLLRLRSDAPTNAFSVLIETRGESGKEICGGNLLISARSVGSNFVAISVRGALIPRRDATTMQPGFGVGRSRFPTQLSLNDGCEITVDQTGRVLRVVGDIPLPAPLGSVAQLFVMDFPSKPESKWDASFDASILDEPLGLGPLRGSLAPTAMGAAYYPAMYSSMGSRSGVATLVVSVQKKFEVREVSESRVKFHQKVTIETPLRVHDEVRFQASGAGDWEFDAAGGFLRGGEMEFTSIANSESSTRRATSKIKIQLLEGKERDAAIAPIAARPAFDPATGQMVSRKLSGAELNQVFADLRSDDESKQRQAVMRIANAEIPNPPREFVEYMTNALFSSDSMLRSAAVKVVADTGGPDSVPLLLRVLKSGDRLSNRYAIVRALARIKDPRAVEPLVALVAEGDSDASSAANALENFDSTAEDAVLALLSEKNVSTKRLACSVLGKIGTAKSLDAIKPLLVHADSMLSSAATEAYRSIQARQ